MFNATKGFMAAAFSVPMVWRIWLGLLMLINLVVPVFFIGSWEAQFTGIAFLVSFSLGIALFKKQGFTQLLGLMHAPWIFLVFYLITVLGQTSINSLFGIWIRAVIVFNSISLIFDAVNVICYIARNRKTVVVL